MKRDRIYDFLFLGLGLLVQIVTFWISRTLSFSDGGGWLSLISGCLGICSVCLAAQGNIYTYLFGFAQVMTYTYLCWTQRFYGEIAINAYYFCTMIYGVIAWRRHLAVASDDKADSSASTALIVPRRLAPSLLAGIAVAILVGSVLAGLALSAWTDDTQPFLDAFTTIPALVAQVLMILVYREHWFIWLAVDILSVVLWLRAGDYCMAAQYAFWCANCLYGLRRWRSLEK